MPKPDEGSAAGSRVTELHIDFETRSTVELPEVGIDLYSRHPTTEAWCMAWAIGEGPVELWALGAPCPSALRAHVEAGGAVVAHNASFELAIWNNVMAPRFGWPPLRVSQVRDTMAQAYAMSLPGSLEKAAAAVGIQEQKDLAGGRLMLQMSRPRETKADGTIVWWDEADKVARLHEYCRQDVRVERELDKRLTQLSAQEQRIWRLDYGINARGFYVDRPAIEAALEVVRSESERLHADIRRVTSNFVGFTTENARLTQWLNSRGVGTESVAKAEILDLLADESLPADCRSALLIRQEAGKSSMAKLSKILTALSADGRLRNTLAYHAASTGRWAGRRVQPHNFPRPKIKQKDIDAILDSLPSGVARHGGAGVAALIDSLFGRPLDILPQCLRGIIRAAPGNDLMGADFSNVEGRVLAWLSGEQWKLDAFSDFDRGEGPDIYLLSAERIWGRRFKKEDPERQHGKVAELACGFGGGVGAFQQMAKTYMVKVSDVLADEIKTKWRNAHPCTVAYWTALENAALNALRWGGAIIATGTKGREVSFRVSGSFLWCRLPSGRVLCYPYPEIREVDTPWGERKNAVTFMTVVDQQQAKKGKVIADKRNTSKWSRISTYGGSLAENVTQAVARDLLAEAMLRLDGEGYPIVLHVHDEVVVEVPEGERDAHEFENTVKALPAWAAGLPIAAEAWRGRRYQKG